MANMMKKVKNEDNDHFSFLFFFFKYTIQLSNYSSNCIKKKSTKVTLINRKVSKKKT